jgi:hypothetical protein
MRKNVSLGMDLGYKINQEVYESNPTIPNQFSTLIKYSYEFYSLIFIAKKYLFLNKKLAVYLFPKLTSVFKENTNTNRVDNPNFWESQK